MLSTSRLFFNKINRLVHQNQFACVFDEPPFRLHSSSLTILAKQNGLELARLGTIISKKKLRSAVARNRFKRIVRESYRLNQHLLPPCDIIVLAKNNIAQCTRQELWNQLDNLWQKLQHAYKKY